MVQVGFFIFSSWVSFSTWLIIFVTLIETGFSFPSLFILEGERELVLCCGFHTVQGHRVIKHVYHVFKIPLYQLVLVWAIYPKLLGGVHTAFHLTFPDGSQNSPDHPLFGLSQNSQCYNIFLASWYFVRMSPFFGFLVFRVSPEKNWIYRTFKLFNLFNF